MPYQILTLDEYNSLPSIDPNKVYLIIDNNKIIDVKKQNNVNYYYVRDSYPDNYLKPVLNKIVTIENLNLNDINIIKKQNNSRNYYYVPYELININDNNYMIHRFIIDHPTNLTINVYSILNQEMNNNYVLLSDKRITLGNILSPYTNYFAVELLNERYVNNRYKYDISIKTLNLSLIGNITNYDIEVELKYINQNKGSLDFHLIFNFSEYMED